MVEPEVDLTKTYDAVVIGSGAAGGMACHVLTSHGMKVLLYNAQAVSPVTEQVRALARQHGISVVSVTETMPPSFASYQAWQFAQARALLDALGG